MYVKKRLIVILLPFLGILVVSNCKPIAPTPIPGVECPEWQGIIINQSTITDVERLFGEPLQIARSDIEGLDIWSFLYPSTSIRVFVGVSQSGVVQYISPFVHSQQYPVTETYPPTLEQFLEMYGEPQRVTWGSSSRYTRTYIWASKGVAVEGRVPAWSPEWGTGVLRVEYFVPTDEETYLQTWGSDIHPQKGYGVEDAYHNPDESLPVMPPLAD